MTVPHPKGGPEKKPASRPENIAIPVLRPKLPVADSILPYLRRIDESRIYSNFGPLSIEFQERLAERLRLRADEIVCTSSGTTALMAAILATAGPARPERPLAACPALTFAASASAAERCGYRPLIVDVDPENWQISHQSLLAHPRLNEIGLAVAVGAFGKAPSPEPWLKFQEETGVSVVIDGAASFALYESLEESRFSEIPVALSFHATKSLGIGEGGAVVWKSPRARGDHQGYQLWLLLRAGQPSQQPERQA